MILKRLSLYLSCLPAAIVFLHCVTQGTDVAQGGGGSEAVALTGSFAYPDKRPAVLAHVRLRPKFFLSDTGSVTGAVPGSGSAAFDAVTDGNGSFRMDSLKRGEYFLEAADSSGQAILIPCALTGDSAVVRLGTAQLAPTGSVTGSIVPPEGFAGRTYVQVYGLDRQVKADSATGRFDMEGLPQGTYTLRAVYSAAAVDPREIEGVEAVSADTNDIGAIRLASFENENYAAWPHSQRIYMNTTAAGANVAGGVNDFALLVRLGKADFDFSQTDGKDLRFSDAKGKRLRYEVERWDSASGQAEIWVRMDRINGNASDQFLTLHWGLPGATDWSDGRQVFAADAGFAGAWHLDEEAPDTTARNLYKDASGYDPADDHIASTDRGGVIGRGHGFLPGDFASILVADPLLEPNSGVSVSAWIKASKTSVNGGGILSMGDNYSLRVNPDGTGRFSVVGGASWSVSTRENLLDSAWHQLSASYGNNTLSIFVDGKLSATAAHAGYVRYDFYPSFILGKHGNKKPGYEFIGNMDEVEVSGDLARSADWFKLSYENQRPDSKLLEFKP
jgi:hypothetical protein